MSYTGIKDLDISSSVEPVDCNTSNQVLLLTDAELLTKYMSSRCFVDLRFGGGRRCG